MDNRLVSLTAMTSDNAVVDDFRERAPKFRENTRKMKGASYA